MKNFHEIFISDKKTDEDLTKAREEIEALHKKNSDLHFKVMLQIRSILKSDQRKQFFEGMKEHGMKHSKRKEE